MIPRSSDGKQRVLSLSYGKDSMACLGAVEQLGWPLDRIITAEVWATDTIPADFPLMVEFKSKADAIILERYGISVEHYRSAVTFESGFYMRRGRTGRKTKFDGKMYGWPMRRGQWCLQQLKLPAFNAATKQCNGSVQYIGIASDEPNRFHNLSETKISPLVEVGWTEADCMKLCIENGLRSPIYDTANRGGCWFCHNQSVDQLRLLRRNYPELWALLLKWGCDSPVTFKADGHTIHDFDKRFQWEDDGFLPNGKKFRWSDIEQQQMNIWQTEEI